MNNGCIPTDSMEEKELGTKFVLKGTDPNNPEHCIKLNAVEVPSYENELWSSMKRVEVEEAGKIICCQCKIADAVLTWWAERFDGDDSITGMCRPCLDNPTKKQEGYSGVY